MIKYGLISETDKTTLQKTMDLIVSAFAEDVIQVSEVGVYAGATGSGIKEYFWNKQTPCVITGIDNSKDGETIRFQYDKLIIGNSSEVYNQLEDNSQHLVFIDGCHTFPAVVADFFCYAGKVKVGGYLLFHDTGKHINPLHGWQGVGDKNDPDMCLGGVRKALVAIGLLQQDQLLNAKYLEPTIVNEYSQGTNWELVFDEADPNDEAGGICCFKKLY